MEDGDGRLSRNRLIIISRMSSEDSKVDDQGCPCDRPPSSLGFQIDSARACDMCVPASILMVKLRGYRRLTDSPTPPNKTQNSLNLEVSFHPSIESTTSVNRKPQSSYHSFYDIDPYVIIIRHLRSTIHK